MTITGLCLLLPWFLELLTKGKSVRLRTLLLFQKGRSNNKMRYLFWAVCSFPWTLGIQFMWLIWSPLMGISQWWTVIDCALSCCCIINCGNLFRHASFRECLLLPFKSWNTIITLFSHTIITKYEFQSQPQKTIHGPHPQKCYFREEIN